VSSLNNHKATTEPSRPAGSASGCSRSATFASRGARSLKVAALLALCLCGSFLLAGCSRNIKLKPLPATKGGSATVKVELTYNRNDQVTIKLQAPEPAAYGPEFTAYVAWVGTPDGKHAINVGRIRVEGGKGQLVTVTPLRKFLLFLTVEKEGDVMQPGPQVVYEAPKEIEW